MVGVPRRAASRHGCGGDYAGVAPRRYRWRRTDPHRGRFRRCPGALSRRPVHGRPLRRPAAGQGGGAARDHPARRARADRTLQAVHGAGRHARQPRRGCRGRWHRRGATAGLACQGRPALRQARDPALHAAAAASGAGRAHLHATASRRVRARALCRRDLATRGGHGDTGRQGRGERHEHPRRRDPRCPRRPVGRRGRAARAEPARSGRAQAHPRRARREPARGPTGTGAGAAHLAPERAGRPRSGAASAAGDGRIAGRSRHRGLRQRSRGALGRAGTGAGEALRLHADGSAGRDPARQRPEYR